MEPKWETAKIDDVWFGVEDHGLLTFDLGFDFGGSHQGMGHLIVASHYDKEPNKDVSLGLIRYIYDLTSHLTHNLFDLKGKYVEVLHSYEKVYGIRQLRPDGRKEFILKDYLEVK